MKNQIRVGCSNTTKSTWKFSLAEPRKAGQHSVFSWFFSWCILTKWCCIKPSNLHVLKARVQALLKTAYMSHLEGQWREVGKVFPHLATNTEWNKFALGYMQSTISDTTHLKLQILHEHLQHVQTSNSPKKGAALYASLSCAPQPRH